METGQHRAKAQSSIASETKKSTTSHMHQRLSACETITATFTGNWNPDIPKLPCTAYYQHLITGNDINTLVDELSKIAGEGGVAELISPIGPRFLYVRDPDKANEMFSKADDLVDGDQSGVQPKTFHPTTAVNLNSKTKKYKQQRGAFKKNVFDAIDELIPIIRDVCQFYLNEIIDQNGVIKDLNDLTPRIAITVMVCTILGLKREAFSEAEKRELAKDVEAIVHEVSNLSTGTRVVIENMIRNAASSASKQLPTAIGNILKNAAGSIKLTPKLDAIIKRCEANLKKLFKKEREQSQDTKDSGLRDESVIDQEVKDYINQAHEQAEKLRADVKAANTAFHRLPETLSPEARYKRRVAEAKLEKLTNESRAADSKFEALDKIRNTNEARVFQKMEHFVEDCDDFKLEKPEDLYSPEVLGLIKLILAGGFETTSKLIFNYLSFLCEPQKQHIVEGMRKEVSAAESKKPMSEWKLKDLQDLHFCGNVEGEALRLEPPFTFMKSHAEKGFYLGKIWIPKGTMIIIDAHAAHRNAKIHTNGTMLDPSRWTKPFSIDAVNRPDFLTFGRVRVCPGRRLTYYESMIFMTMLISKYDLKSSLKGDLDDHLRKGFTLEVKDSTGPVTITLNPIEKSELEKDKDSEKFFSLEVKESNKDERTDSNTMRCG